MPITWHNVVTCGLNENAVKAVTLLHKGLQGAQEVALDAAAETAIGQFDPLL